MPLSPRVARLEVSEVPTSSNAAWIPLNELRSRMAELPPKDQVVQLTKSGDYEKALRFLQNSGRKVELVESEPGRLIPGRLWGANPFLEECLAHLVPGTAVDLACGCGREAATMAGAGWKVTAIDNLADGLERGQDLAQRHLPGEESGAICWLERDLLKEGLPEGPWDLATMFFFLDRDLLCALPRVIRKGGSLLLETFLEEHARIYGKPRSPAKVLAPGELRGLFPNSQFVRYQEGPCRNRITARAWLRF